MDEHIRFFCPKCGQRLKARIEQARGHQFTCPRCGAAIAMPPTVVPAGEAPPTPPQKQPRSPLAAPSFPSAAPSGATTPLTYAAIIAASLAGLFILGIMIWMLTGVRSSHMESAKAPNVTPLPVANAATEQDAALKSEVAKKASAEKAAAERAAEKAAKQRAAEEQAVAEKAAAEKAAAEKSVAEQAAAKKVAEEKTAAEKAAAETLEVQRLIARLKSGEAGWGAESLVKDLVKIGQSAVAPLVACLKDKSSDKQSPMRQYAADALGEIGDKRAVEPLIACLRDENTWVGQRAAKALGKLGDKRAVDALIACLEDRGSYSHREAAESLGKLGDKRAVEPLIACLNDNNSFVRREAAEALGKLGDARVAELLLPCLEDREDLGVCECAMKAIIKLGESRRAVEPLIARLGDRDNQFARRFAAEALGKVGDKRSLVPLIASLKDNDGDTREKAAEALGKLGDKQALGPLSAQAGNRQRTVELLEQASQLLRSERDGISADSTLADLAASFAIAGSALGDLQLFERGLSMVGQVYNVGFKSLALASVFGHLCGTGDATRSMSVKKQLLSQMESLSGFEYCLSATQVAEILAKTPAAKNEVASLLEMGLTRARSDHQFGATAVRDIGIAYAKAARHLAEKKFVERARDIARELHGAAERAAVCQDLAVSCAVFGAKDEAKNWLGKEKEATSSIEDSWARRTAETEVVVADFLVGTIVGDTALVEASLKAADAAENRKSVILSIVEAFVDIAKSKNDPALVAKAAEMAERLTEPFDRDCGLVDRVEILARTGHRDGRGEAYRPGPI